MTTTVVYAGTVDGVILMLDQRDPGAGSYAAARAGTAESSVADSIVESLAVGQIWWDYGGGDTDVQVEESFIGFDTSPIADTDTVSAAVLNVTADSDNSTTDFTIEARLYDWGAGLEVADWVAGASLSGLTLLATKTTASGFTAGTAYDFTDVAMPANVNKTGSTRMILCSSRTTGNNAPTGDEYVGIRAADYAGTTSDPKLTVTHAAGVAIAGMPLVRALRKTWAG